MLILYEVPLLIFYISFAVLLELLFLMKVWLFSLYTAKFVMSFNLPDSTPYCLVVCFDFRNLGSDPMCPDLLSIWKGDLVSGLCTLQEAYGIEL